MSLKRTLTSVAVDSARDYFRERLSELKELDLDKDGQKDVDQINELLGRLAEKVKESLEATDFPKLATGLEQVMSGAALITASVDRDKLGAATAELGGVLKELGKLAQLGVAEVKQRADKR